MRELNSASTGEISKAMSKAFMKIDNAKKSTQAYSYKYADLGSIIEGTKEILGQHGLHVKHQMDFEILANGEMMHVMITEIRHDSDEFFRSYFPIKSIDLKGQNAHQAFGSAMTYARRYCLSALLNIAQVDDDGKAAGQKGGIQKASGAKQSYSKPTAAQNLTQSTGGKPASTKQIEFLKTLVADTGHTWEKYLESKGVSFEKDLKSDVVSASIAKLKEKSPI